MANWLQRILARIAKRSSIENPGIPLTGGTLSAMVEGARVSMSGEVVTPLNALTYHPFWRGCRLIAGDIGRLPLQVRRRLNRGSEDAIGHPVWRTLTQRPSENVTPYMLKETMSVSGCIYGNEFAWIRREGWRPEMGFLNEQDADLGRAVELRFIRRTRVLGFRTIGNEIWYQVAPISATTNLGPMDEQVPDQIWAKDMLHVRRMTNEGHLGLEPFNYGTNNLGKNLAAESYQSEFFLNDATPNGMIVPKEGTTPETGEKLLTQLQNRHRGKGKRNKIGFLPAPAEWLKTGVDPQHIQLIDLLKFGIIEAANLLDIPPYKLGSDVSTSFRSLQERNKDYHDQTLDPWLTNWEQECMKLFSEAERESGEYFVKFDRTKILQSDPEAMARIHQIYHGMSVMNSNQIREDLGLNAYEGGDFYFIQLNQGIVTPDGVQNPNMEQPDEEDEEATSQTEIGSGEDDEEADAVADRALRVLVEQTARRLMMQATAALRNIKDPDKFRKHVARLRNDNRHKFCLELRPVLALRGQMHDVEPLADAMLDQIYQQLMQVEGRDEALRNSATAAVESATTWAVDLFHQFLDQTHGKNRTHSLPAPAAD